MWLQYTQHHVLPIIWLLHATLHNIIPNFIYYIISICIMSCLLFYFFLSSFLLSYLLSFDGILLKYSCSTIIFMILVLWDNVIIVIILLSSPFA